jgi:predicted GIY-YIG superfamily endonuclease
MYVYKLRSKTHPYETHIGIALDFNEQLRSHNNGESILTTRFKPWAPEMIMWFNDDAKAKKFEKYLKSGAGRVFCARHF